MSETLERKRAGMRPDRPRLEGEWRFSAGGGAVADQSGHGRALTVHGSPALGVESPFGGAVRLNGRDQWLQTSEPVLCTEQSFSVAAWVRLERVALGGRLELADLAVTAISQDSPTHSPFYLGIRTFEELAADGATSRPVMRWNVTIAPVDGSVTGTLEWRHASASRPLDESALDRWILLVATCDVPNGVTRLYIPGDEDQGESVHPEGWPFWSASGGLCVGRARWLGRIVDQWPGSIGPVKVFSGLLTAADARSLYESDTLASS